LYMVIPKVTLLYDVSDLWSIWCSSHYLLLWDIHVTFNNCYDHG
jgi:hypothetical protein